MGLEDEIFAFRDRHGLFEGFRQAGVDLSRRDHAAQPAARMCHGGVYQRHGLSELPFSRLGRPVVFDPAFVEDQPGCVPERWRGDDAQAALRHEINPAFRRAGGIIDGRRHAAFQQFAIGDDGAVIKRVLTGLP